MNTRSLRTSIAAAMGGAVLLAGLMVGASFALAQDADEPAPTEESVDGDSVERGFGFFKDHSRMWGGNLDDLAAEFGTTLDELKDQLHDGATLEDIATDLGINLDEALAQLREEALTAIDEEVASGNLTQAQGDAIKERIESFDPGEGFPFGPRGFRGAPREGFDLGADGFRFGGMRDFGFLGGDLDGLLEGLDFDFDELRGLLESGMTLDEALESLDVDLDTLLADALSEASTMIDELVADGTLSQEQADSIKEMLEGIDLSQGLPFGLGGFGFGMDMEKFDFKGFDFEGFDFDGFRGPRGHGHGFGFDCDGNLDDGNAEGALLDV